jgi:transcriptional regulator with XRE-family HTH domain
MKTFKEILKHERLKQHLSATKLSELSGLHVTLISALEHGHRCIGEKSAKKLSIALGLKEREQEQFIYSAIEESSDRLLEASEDYPVELLNYLPIKLQKIKVSPDLIRDVKEQENKLIIFLKNKNLIEIETKLLTFEPCIKYT